MATTRGVGQILSGTGKVALSAASLPFAVVKDTITTAQYMTGSKNLTKPVQADMFSNVDKVPAFYKLSILVVFFVFFYKIIYDIGIFFGLNSLELYIYMAWFGMLLLFASFLPRNRTIFK